MTDDTIRATQDDLLTHIRDEVEHASQHTASLVLIAWGISTFVMAALVIGLMPFAIGSFVEYPWLQDKSAIEQRIKDHEDAIESIHNDLEDIQKTQQKILESVSDPLTKSVLRDRRLRHENTQATRERVAEIASRDNTKKSVVHGSMRGGASKATSQASHTVSP